MSEITKRQILLGIGGLFSSSLLGNLEALAKTERPRLYVIEDYVNPTKEPSQFGRIYLDTAPGISLVHVWAAWCKPCVEELQDTKLHEDSIHRGPAQVYPAIREALREAMIGVGAVLYEPLQVLQIEALVDHLGAISKLISNKRGQMLDMNQEGSVYMTVKAKIPVAETFGLSSELRSATEGRGNFFVLDQIFEKVPSELQPKVIGQIRQRKGLGVNQ